MIDLEQVKKKVEELRQRLEWGRPYSYDLEQALAITSDLIVEVELYKKLYEEAQEVYAFSVKTENDLQCEKEDLDKQHVFRIAELKHKLDMINSTNQRHVEEIESLQREKAELEDDKSELAGDLYRKMSKAAELERQQLKSWHDTMGGITTRNGYQFGLSDDPATCSMMILHFIDKLEKQLAEITLRREETVMANEHLMEQVCGMRKAWEHILVLGYHGMGCNKCFKYHDAMASTPTCKHKEETEKIMDELNRMRAVHTEAGCYDSYPKLREQLTSLQAELAEAKRFVFDDNTVKALKAEVKRLEARWAESVDLVTEIEERAKTAESQLTQAKEAITVYANLLTIEQTATLAKALKE